MTGDPVYLTDEERASRISAMAAGRPDQAITMCSEAGCSRAASHGPWCREHRPAPPGDPPTTLLSADQLEAVRQQVEADAAALFVLAMNWITRRHVTHLGVDIGAELERVAGEIGR
ncbi:MAG: hypothetical protein ACRDYV_02130 [Acidimicrobiia bacterium]